MVIYLFIIFINSLQIHPEAFTGLEDTTRSLWMRRSNLDRIPVKALHRLNRLHFLHLENNRITHIRPYSFVNNINMVELIMSENMIFRVGIKAFDGLEKLKFLDLSRNKLNVLKRGVFGGLKNLVHLDLSENLLRRITPNLFMGLSRLRSLQLNNNLLKVLDKRCFTGAVLLLNMKLEGNPIEEIKKYTFIKTPKIKFLSLNLTKVIKIEEGAFGGLTKLKNLALGEFPGRLYFPMNKTTKDNSTTVKSTTNHSPQNFLASSTKLKSISLTNYTSQFKGFPREILSPNFNFPQLSIFVVKIECSCAQDWIRKLTSMGSYVHGYCINNQPISCFDRSFDNLRLFERIQWNKI